MVAIPFPLSSAPGATPQESAGRLINCYAEPLGNQRAVWRRIPGLRGWGTSGESGFRGQIAIGNFLYTAYDGALVKFGSSGGAATSVGALAGSGRVFFARNNAATPDQAVVTENGAFTFTDSAVLDYPDVDLPQPRDVAFQDGYFFFPIGDGRVFASGLNTTAINALDFVTCEGKPDALLRAIPWNGRMIFAGTGSLEIFVNTANEVGFPYSREVVIPVGLAAAGAIAGHEDGFGLALIFVASDNTVRQLNGEIPEKISPPDLDRLIEALADKDQLEAGVHISNGHAFWVISSLDWTWAFNLNNQTWHERESYLMTRWRGQKPVYAFGKWLAGNTQDGKILEITSAVHTEDGARLGARLESGPVAQFPSGLRVGRAAFDFVTGVGIATGTEPNETDPSVEISWSNDGGVNWSVPLIRKIGRQSKTGQVASVINTGTSGAVGRRWRLEMSDPVYFGFLGGEQSADVLAA